MPKHLRIVVLALTFVAVLVSLLPRLASSRIPGSHEGYAPEQPLDYSHRLHAGELGIDCQYCHFGAERSRHAGIPPANVCMNCHKYVTATTGQKLEAKDKLVAASVAATTAHSAAVGAEAPAEEIARLAAAAEAAKKKVVGFNPGMVLSPKIAELYGHVGFDAKTATWDPARARTPIRWQQVHRLPDFVFFDHRSHIRAGVACQKCHGPVESMTRVRQHSNLSMGWCVNCHRDAHANGIDGKPASPSLDCSACHY